MNWLHYLRRAVTLPPHRTARIAGGMLHRRLSATRTRLRDYRRPTFASDAHPPAVRRVLRDLPMDLLRADREMYRALATRYRAHVFDLLGSGWVTVQHGITCAGLEGRHYEPWPAWKPDVEGRWLVSRLNRANVAAAREIWRLIEPGYQPIDWQLDVKSGWRWAEAMHASQQSYGRQPGADVKLPWELARLQHLPQMALAFALEGDASLARECGHQMLDFIATNPPRFGVNWLCTMDVAIRAANMVFAFDLCRAAGHVWDDAFDLAFRRSLLDHGRHIANHLEWHETFRSNHYLANVAGLTVIASFLEPTAETRRWLRFATSELLLETQAQFHEEGSNFEASTAYHRLSAEMVAWATACWATVEDATWDRNIAATPVKMPGAPLRVAWVDHVSFGQALTAHRQRLAAMARFTEAISDPDGRVPQIGDNDSGRFLKLRPAIRPGDDTQPGAEPIEDHTDHRHLPAAIAGLLGAPVAEVWESTLIAQLASSRMGEALPARQGEAVGAVRSFGAFGLYVQQRGPWQWWVRCGSVGQCGNGGHAHHDQLSLELSCDGQPLWVDTGTYLYTPLPEWRERFRATRAHNTVAVPGREQHTASPVSLFMLSDTSRARCEVHEPGRFVGVHEGFGGISRRTLTLTDRAVEGEDQCAASGPAEAWFHAAPGVAVAVTSPTEVRFVRGGRVFVLTVEGGEARAEPSQYSRGYGWREPIEACCVRFEQRLRWRLTVEGGSP